MCIQKQARVVASLHRRGNELRKYLLHIEQLNPRETSDNMSPKRETKYSIVRSEQCTHIYRMVIIGEQFSRENIAVALLCNAILSLAADAINQITPIYSVPDANPFSHQPDIVSTKSHLYVHAHTHAIRLFASRQTNYNSRTRLLKACTNKSGKKYARAYFFEHKYMRQRSIYIYAIYTCYAIVQYSAVQYICILYVFSPSERTCIHCGIPRARNRITNA